jgi:hypothetical protein
MDWPDWRWPWVPFQAKAHEPEPGFLWEREAVPA